MDILTNQTVTHCERVCEHAELEVVVVLGGGGERGRGVDLG
jgi:hypothetical protein